jgi:hypothetical protein
MLIKKYLFKNLNLRKMMSSITKNKKKYIFMNNAIKILKFNKFSCIGNKKFQKII